MAAVFHEFASPASLAYALADRIESDIESAVLARGRAAIALSGGTTPRAFLAELATRRLRWNKVSIALVDDRFVPDTAERSNARLVREHLLAGEAAAATFVPLLHDAVDLDDNMKRAEARLAKLKLPFDAVVLGMGTDGHTASLFPDGEGTAEALDIAADRLVAAVRSPTAPEPRLTLTLPPIASARSLYLHIEGEAKRRVYEAAAKDPDATPIGQVIAAASQIDVFWAPLPS